MNKERRAANANKLVKNKFTVKEVAYVARTEADVERIVNEGFVVKQSENEDDNLLGIYNNIYTVPIHPNKIS